MRERKKYVRGLLSTEIKSDLLCEEKLGELAVTTLSQNEYLGSMAIEKESYQP